MPDDGMARGVPQVVSRVPWSRGSPSVLPTDPGGEQSPGQDPQPSAPNVEPRPRPLTSRSHLVAGMTLVFFLLLRVRSRVSMVGAPGPSTGGAGATGGAGIPALCQLSAHAFAASSPDGLAGSTATCMNWGPGPGRPVRRRGRGWAPRRIKSGSWKAVCPSRTHIPAPQSALAERQTLVYRQKGVSLRVPT